jgi:hypothetical protein
MKLFIDAKTPLYVYNNLVSSFCQNKLLATLFFPLSFNPTLGLPAQLNISLEISAANLTGELFCFDLSAISYELSATSNVYPVK